MTIFKELKRRNVFKVASVYLVTSWLILQIVAVVSPYLHLPIMFGTIITVVLGIGFPVACIIAWAFELTPEGLKFTKDVQEDESISEVTGSKINRWLACALTLAIAFITYDKLLAPDDEATKTLSIAVLPFADMSPDNSQEYFGDGIAEEILNALARINNLLVISRTSSFEFKNKNSDIRKIGDILGVNYILEGSIRKDSETIRVTAQLIEVESGSHIWSETYDRTLDGIFALQDELTFAITQALKLNLLPDEVNSVAGLTRNEQAYELFVKGRSLAYQRDPESLVEASSYLQQSITLDEKFYLAKAQLYAVYEMADSYGGFTAAEREKQREKLFTELLVAPQFPLKHYVEAMFLARKNHINLAFEKLQLAFKQAPNDPFIENSYLLALSHSKGFEETVEKRLQVLKQNPSNIVNLFNLAYSSYVIGNTELSLSAVNKILAKDVSTSLTIDILLFKHYVIESSPQAALDYLKSINGEKNTIQKAHEISLNLLLNNNNIALNKLHNELQEYPENFKAYEWPLILLYIKQQQQALSFAETELLTQLQLPEKFQLEQKIIAHLQTGDATLFSNTYAKNGYITLEQFEQVAKDNPIMVLLYGAILKSKGTEVLPDPVALLVKDSLPFCMVNEGRGGYSFCPLVLYLDDSLTLDVQFQYFQNSLQMLDTFIIGMESLILTDPSYYGVKQHPEFETVANQFLDRTFRKWQLSNLSKK